MREIIITIIFLILLWCVITINQNMIKHAKAEENRILQNGTWTKTSSTTVTDIHKYSENTPYLLHNRHRSVRLSTFPSKPKNEWKSLQLIQVQNAKFFQDDFEGKKKRKCRFRYRNISYTYTPTHCQDQFLLCLRCKLQRFV